MLEMLMKISENSKISFQCKLSILLTCTTESSIIYVKWTKEPSSWSLTLKFKHNISLLNVESFISLCLKIYFCIYAQNFTSVFMPVYKSHRYNCACILFPAHTTVKLKFKILPREHFEFPSAHKYTL